MPATTCCHSTAWPLPARKPAQRPHLLLVPNGVDSVLANRGRRCVHGGLLCSRMDPVNALPSPVRPAAIRVNVSPSHSCPRSARQLKRPRCNLFLRCRSTRAIRGIFTKPHHHFWVIGGSELRKRHVTPIFPLARKSAPKVVFDLRRALQSQSLRKQSARSSASDFSYRACVMVRCSICFPVVVVIVANGRRCSLRHMRGGGFIVRGLRLGGKRNARFTVHERTSWRSVGCCRFVGVSLRHLLCRFRHRHGQRCRQRHQRAYGCSA